MSVFDIVAVGDEGKEKAAEPRGFALVVVMFNEPFAVCWQGCEVIREFVNNIGGGETFNASRLDCPALEDGAWIVALRLYDDGPGDTPGTREWGLGLRDPVRCTASQWDEFRTGNYPWDWEE